MHTRRWLERIVNYPLRQVGLKLIPSGRIDDYEARISALMRQQEDVSRQINEHQLRRQESEARLSAAAAALEDLRQRLAPAAGLPLPVYLTDDLRPAAQLAHGASPHRIVVCSIPKAGTYLVDRLLELLGCVPSRLHLLSSVLTDYRFATMREARENWQRLLFDVSLDRAVELMLPGQFSVGHLECSDHVRRVLSSVKKLFVFRDLRDGVVSFLRFLASTGRGGEATRAWKDLPPGTDQMLRFLDAAGQDYFNMTLPMIDWFDQPDVFFISFETLYGDSGAEEQRSLIGRLHSFLDLPGDVPDIDTLRGSLIGAPTMTWSGGRVSRDAYWNDEVERRFEAFGGVEASRRLGYEASDAGQIFAMPDLNSAHRRAA
jgi:hypothetical protein